MQSNRNLHHIPDEQRDNGASIDSGNEEATEEIYLRF